MSALDSVDCTKHEHERTSEHDEATEDEATDDEFMEDGDIMGLCLPDVLQAKHELSLRKEIEGCLNPPILTTTRRKRKHRQCVKNQLSPRPIKKTKPKVNIYALVHCPRELRSFRCDGGTELSSTVPVFRRIRFTTGHDLKRKFTVDYIEKTINQRPIVINNNV